MADLFGDFRRKKIDALYDDMFDTFKKECRIYYPPIITNCTSCLSIVSNDYQGNVDIHGQLHSNLNSCDYCGGSGKIEQEVYDTIYLVCNWKSSCFRNLFLQVNLPEEALITKGKIADYINTKRCNYMVVQPNQSEIVPNKYKRFAEGNDAYCITQGKWFFQVWSDA